MTIAVRYSAARLAVGPDGTSSSPILAYQLQQNALMPLLANTVIYDIALSYIKQRWADQVKRIDIGKLGKEGISSMKGGAFENVLLMIF